MGKIEFDFREGLDKDHIVYKRSGFHWTHCVYYIGYLLFTWGITVAFFALFQFVYTNYEPVAFPIYIALWLAFVISIIIVAVMNLVNYKKTKHVRKAKKDAERKKSMSQGIEMIQQKKPEEGDNLVN
jgi:hypothetical protein